MFPGTRRTGHKKEKKQKLAIFKQGPVREVIYRFQCFDYELKDYDVIET